jgi:hypothetical protein
LTWLLAVTWLPLEQLRLLSVSVSWLLPVAWLHTRLHTWLHAWLHAWLHVLYARLDTWLWLVAAISVLGRTITSLGLLTDRLLLWHVASISAVSLRLLWHTLRLLLVLNRLLLGLGWLLHWLGLLSGFLL